MHFAADVRAIPDELAKRMRGVSWHATLPGGFVPPSFDELRILTLTHWNFAREIRQGELIVAGHVAESVVHVFEAIFAAQFPIEQLRLIDEFGGDDERSMAANNSSAFNCRLIAGTTRPSRHALGLAIDINPLQNPYVVQGVVQPKAAEGYADRSQERPGMLFETGAVVSAFARAGWAWGGTWREPKDYHHFELPNGRAT